MSKTKTTTTLVERKTGATRNKHNLSSRWEIGGHRVRVSVSLDPFYHFQSCAHAQVWREADTSWKNVAALDVHEMPKEAHLQPGRQVNAYEPDVEALLASEAELISRAKWALGV